MTQTVHEFQRLYVDPGDCIEQWGYDSDDIIEMNVIEDPRSEYGRRCLEVWVLYETEAEE